MTRLIPPSLVVVLLLGVACGYTAVDSRRPFGQSAIMLDPITETSPSGLAGELTRSLSQTLATGAMGFTPYASEATARLGGRIISTRTRGASITSTDRAAEAFVFEARIELQLVSTSTGEVLWRLNLPANEAFRQVTGGNESAIETETARRLAMGRLADALALEIREHLLIASMAAVPEES